MNINCVFSGGGVKAFAFIGALQSLESKHYHIEKVAGTSAGAIIACLIAAKYTVDEIYELLMELHLKQFMDLPLLSKTIPFGKWLMLYFNMGIYKGERFEKWLYRVLAKKGVYTFADMEDERLKVIVSDVTLGKLVIFPDDISRIYGLNKRDLTVASAVRMSASFPYFFMPKKWRGADDKEYYFVDGGLLSNFPLWIFNQRRTKQRNKTLGFTLQDSLDHIKPQKVNNALDMLQAIFIAMLHAHDTRYIAKSKQDNIVFIPVKNVQTTDLLISNEEKKKCIQLGKKKTDEFLHLYKLT